MSNNCEKEILATPVECKTNECGEEDLENPEKVISRKEKKRLAKRALRLANRSERRQREKQRRKERRKILKEKGLLPKLSSEAVIRETLKTRRSLLSTGNIKPVRIVLDLDFDGMMNSHDTGKCVKQCMFVYAISRRTIYPIDLHFTGLKNNGEIHKGLLKNTGYKNWTLTEHLDKRHTSVFAKSELIYLSSESSTVLDELSPDNVYVIGGLVDHNHYKSFCYTRAKEDGIRTARLPLTEYIDIKSRTVLTSVHVFQILARVLEGKSWTEAFLDTIPARKGAKAKTKSTTISRSSDEDDSISGQENDDNDSN